VTLNSRLHREQAYAEKACTVFHFSELQDNRSLLQIIIIIIISSSSISSSSSSSSGPCSSVGIATEYGLDGPGSNPGGDEIFRPSRPALGPTQSPVQWVPGLSRG